MVRSNLEDAQTFNTEWKGGKWVGQRKVLSGTYHINRGDLAVHHLDPNGVNQIVRLPERAPGLIFFVFNVGGAGDLIVQTDLGVGVATMPPLSGIGFSASAEEWGLIQGGVAGQAVSSVNEKTGAVVLDPDDLDDATTTHKFISEAELAKLAGVEAGADVTDATNVAGAGAYMLGANTAADVTFDPSGLTHADGTDVQEALADLDAAITAGGAGDYIAEGVVNTGNVPTFGTNPETQLADSGKAAVDLVEVGDLGDAAFKNTGTESDEVAAGDHGHPEAVASGASGFLSGTDKAKLDGIEAAADVTDAGNVGSTIHGVAEKTTPVDADMFALIDSAASNVLKKLSWANIKTAIGTYIASAVLVLTNKTFDANGTGNSLSNVETADIASGSKTGADADLVTGTAGSNGQTAIWNSDGDLVGTTRGSTFSVHKNGIAQTGVASTVDTLVTWSTEISDTEGIFASNAFTPTDGSVWLCECVIQVSAGAVDGTFNRMRLYRNGSSFELLTSKTDAVGGNTTLFATFVIFGNGQTHEIYVDLDGAGDKTLQGAESSTKWKGVRLF